MDKDKFHELVHKYISREITDEEQKALSEQIEVDREFRKLFEALTKSTLIRSSYDVLEQKANNILKRAAELDSATTIIKPAKKLNIHSLSIRIAAAAAVVFLLATTIYLYRSQESAEEYEHIVQTEKGERKHFLLSDGTQIWLNSGSSIRYNDAFGKKNRSLKLSGEAYFDVKSNKKLPMTIDTRELSVKVIGTSFNMRAYEDEKTSETSLIEGRIELSVKKQGNAVEKHLLAPGEKIKVTHRAELIAAENPKSSEANKAITEHQDATAQVIKSEFFKTDTEQAPTEIAWKDNTLAFDAEPLDLAISKLEKWYDTSIVVTNASLTNLNVSGTFKEESIEEVLQFLQLTGVSFKFRKENNTIYIY